MYINIIGRVAAHVLYKRNIRGNSAVVLQRVPRSQPVWRRPGGPGVYVPLSYIVCYTDCAMSQSRHRRGHARMTTETHSIRITYVCLPLYTYIITQARRPANTGGNDCESRVCLSVAGHVVCISRGATGVHGRRPIILISHRRRSDYPLLSLEQCLEEPGSRNGSFFSFFLRDGTRPLKNFFLIQTNEKRNEIFLCEEWTIRFVPFTRKYNKWE